ncbi:MAG: hypothetical protein O3C49_04930 [Proteobacteria bacterium]|nr:hypothetical protein [Pseudomonadota bacterium]MDA1323348.1 hypothetical protein [Pseudomonadota bacterium]
MGPLTDISTSVANSGACMWRPGVFVANSKLPPFTSSIPTSVALAEATVPYAKAIAISTMGFTI